MNHVWRVEVPGSRSPKWLMSFYHKEKEHEEHPGFQDETEFQIFRTNIVHSKEGVIEFFKRKFGIKVLGVQLLMVGED